MRCELRIECDTPEQAAKVAAAVAGATGRAAEVSREPVPRLPKPKRVEAGQWWGHDPSNGIQWRPFRILDVEAAEASQDLLSDPEAHYLGDGERPVESSAPEAAPTPPAAKAPPIPGPTTRDAVAGMLLRHRYEYQAKRLVFGFSTPEDVIRALERDEHPSVPRRHCIAALEALAAREARRAGHGVDDACAECAPGEQAEGGLEVEAIRDALGDVREGESLADAVRRLASRAAYLELKHNETAAVLARQTGETLPEAARRVVRAASFDRQNRDAVSTEAESLRKLVEALKDKLREQHEAHRDVVWEVKGILGASPTVGLKPAAEKVREALFGAVAEARENKDALERAAAEQKRLRELDAAWRRETGVERPEDLNTAMAKCINAMLDEARVVAREQGAAEMRVMAATTVRTSKCEDREGVAEEIRALPLDGEPAAPGEQVGGRREAVDRLRKALAEARADVDAVKLSRDKARRWRSVAEDELKAVEEVLLSAGATPQSGESLADTVRRVLENREMIAPPANLCAIAAEATRATDEGLSGGAPSQDEPQATGEDRVTGWDGATRLEMSWPRGTDPDAVALAAARLVSAPGALRGDVQVLYAAAAGLRLAIPKDRDPRAVLATVAELLGLPDQQDEARALSELRRTHHADDADEPADIDDRWQHRRERLSRAAHGSANAFERAYVHGMRDAYTVAGVEMRRARGQAESPTAAPDRETLGRAVHEVWREAWTAFGYPSGRRTWGECTEQDHEADRRIGERLFAMGVQHAGRAPAKPAIVEPWSVWLCAGIGGELEVCCTHNCGNDQPIKACLRRVGADSDPTVTARSSDMLGLREWTFVRGPTQKPVPVPADGLIGVDAGGGL